MGVELTEKNSNFFQKKQNPKMDGGGFSNTTQPQRAKGVTPVSGDIINRSTGQADSLIIPLPPWATKN